MSTLFELLTHDESKQSYIILDALDECPIDRREQLFSLILDRLPNHPGSYNLLFTSRKETDIEHRMSEHARAASKHHNVPILTGDVNADVRLHVGRFISDHRTMKDWSKELKAEIEDAIAGGAQGMFVCDVHSRPKKSLTHLYQVSVGSLPA